MGHRFAAVGTVVDDEPEALVEAELPGEQAGGEQEMAQQELVGGRGGAHPWYRLSGHEQQVNRRLGLDVVEDDAVFVLVFDASRNLPGDDFFE